MRPRTIAVSRQQLTRFAQMADKLPLPGYMSTAAIEGVWLDLQYAVRTFRLNKGFFAVAVLSLALGIGANTAIFQLLDAVRLRTLPVSHPERLFSVKIADNDHCCNGNFADRTSDLTYAQWQEIRDRQQAFSKVFAWGDQRFNLSERGEPRLAEGLFVSGEFFQTLAIRPALGRLITASYDTQACGAPGAVASYAFWQRELAGDPAALGRKISLDGHRVSIIGITPAVFFGVEVGRRFDVAIPICAEPIINGENSHLPKRHHWWLDVIGQLKPGWTAARAAAHLKAISNGVFSNTLPPNYRADMAKYYTTYELAVRPAGSGISSVRETYSESLLLLLGIAGLVLLIACSNLANLMLARASVREQEMAVRLAIGADRARLIRQLLIESLALAISGAALGGLLADFLSRYMVTFLTTSNAPLYVELTPDWRVLGFTATLAILTCILFGLTPALRATQADGSSAKASGRGMTADRQRFGLRRALVVSQVALSLVLVVGALLFVRSLRNLLTLDAGFQRSGLLTTRIDCSRLGFNSDRRAVLYREFLDSVRQTPGVAQAASVRIVQTSGGGWNENIQLLGQHSAKSLVPWFDRVSAGYFRTMGTPLIAGRDFDDHDTLSSPEVAIVNQEFCDKFLNKANPIGKQFRILTGPGEMPHLFQIVGLVKDSKYQSLRDNFQPLVFVAQTQDKETGPGINLVIRSAAPLGSLLSALRRTIQNENGGLSYQFEAFNTRIEESLVRERLMATLSGFFGVLAGMLAVVGLYGVISYMVTRRRGEIGIRMALGANRSGIMALVLKEAALLLIAGLVVGAALSVAAARAASSLLYGLKPNDPVTMALATVTLAIISLLASFVPALRAARIEPMTALRKE